MKINVEPHKQYSAFALITANEGDNRRYLLQWNTRWEVFNLIGGKLDNSRGDENSLARTIYRELEEELGLRSEEECLILNQIRELELQQFSQREKCIKKYHFGIFEVDLFPRLQLTQENKLMAARWLSTGRENIFVSKAEIENLSTASGRPISATTRHILRKLGELDKPATGLLSLPGAVRSESTLQAHGDVELNTLFQQLARTEAVLEKILNQIRDKALQLDSGSHSLLQQAQVTLKESESRYRQLMARIPAIVCELTPDGTILFVNEAITPLTGYTPGELIGQNWWRIFFPDEAGHQVNALYRQFQVSNVHNYEVVVRAKNGRYVTLLWNSANSYDAMGNLDGIIGFCIDLSQQKRVETALELSQEIQRAQSDYYLRDMLNSIPLNIALLDGPGEI